MQVGMNAEAVLDPGSTLVSPVAPYCLRCRTTRLIPETERLVCPDCAQDYPITAGVTDLRLDRTMDTQLDLDSYDAAHSVSEANAWKLYSAYARGYERLEMPAGGGKVFEIGAGTGNLTTGLVRWGPFSEIHCSDISPRFMEALSAKLKPSEQQRLHRYLLDANAFPFEAETFDVVVGSSILHHLIHFEGTLAESLRVLKPGGVAIFGEPMMESRALAYLAAGQIVAVNAMLPKSRLDPETERLLTVVSRIGAEKLENLKQRGPDVEQMEDKFVFSEVYMRDLARQLGFRDHWLAQYAPVEDAAEMAFTEIEAALQGTQADLDAIRQFAPVIEPFRTAYQAALGEYMSQDFVINVFMR